MYISCNHFWGAGWGLFQGGASTSNTQQFCTINLRFVTGFHVPGKAFPTSGKHLQQFLREGGSDTLARLLCANIFCVEHVKLNSEVYI